MLAPTPVLQWFQPPTLERAEDTRRARTFWIMAWPFFAVVTLVLAVAIAIEPDTLARRAVTIAAVGGLITALHALNRRGRTITASWILVLGLTCIVTQRAWITGGIHAPVAGFYALFILMAGALINERAARVTALVAFAGAWLLTVAELFAWLQPRPGAGSAAAALTFTVLVIGIALVIQNFIVRSARNGSMREDLVHMFVHDMRNPILVVNAQLEMAREIATGDTATHIDEAMGSTHTLNQLTGNLLAVSRFEGANMPLELETVDVAAVAHSVVRSLRVIAPDREMLVIADSRVSCRCDAGIVRRVIENLVTNAIKHAPRGRIVVDVRTHASRVRIAVRDEGRGIPPDARKRLFTKFASDRLRSETGFESTGLGLAFCKMAVDSHGGTIRVEHATPQGCVFIVELPR